MLSRRRELGAADLLELAESAPLLLSPTVLVASMPFSSVLFRRGWLKLTRL